MSEPVIVCRDLARRFDDGATVVDVLTGVSLEVAAGETIAITGASGSGKSTLLHLLGGLDLPSGGSVRLCGHDVHALRETERAALRNRMLGFVYQFHHLLPEFSALENVAMPLLIGGAGAAAAASRARAMLERIGLAARAEHRPAELSGGERQRVAIARALIAAPRCLLADEPTGNLDQSNAALVCDLLLELCEEHAAALIVVTHDTTIAARMQRRYALSAGGLAVIDD
ncbi:MAG: ATP-binding cassette domain-containing protein [Gammaproteobacteria bacterium]